ncbi:hypothetical protein B4129_0037 [Bacillus safensis]|nr:hypothetical protein B4129_0037 [Bacillus safensis]
MKKALGISLGSFCFHQSQANMFKMIRLWVIMRVVTKKK